VEIDRAAGTVRLPAGMRIDLGGIAKGAFVDLLVARLAEWPGGLVDAGGDLRAWGTAPDGLPWRVAIENPSQPEQDAAFVDLLDPTRSGAVATSGVLRRRLRGNGHHLIDPRTGLPAVTTFAAVTAIAPTCAAAEIAAKSLLIGDWTAATGLTDALAVAAGISFDGSLQFIDGGYRDAIEIELAV
jgi:thiamine biosynthesis lipoprotein